MCDQINPDLRTQMIREMAEEIRKWFREFRRRIISTGNLGVQEMRRFNTDGQIRH